ncbi:cytochrome c biogenesis protein CcdC [Edaphobacter sp. HDX4]|uniref:CcdC family protein n=1 Tax=Edaphobacter sp. HDX4 TaxID=2794064 RepID=UPI002FE591F0
MVDLPGASVGTAILGFFAVLAWRIREGRSPVTLKKVIIPPLGMATGFSMFVIPVFRVPWQWALGAFVIGASVLAYPLIRTSRMTREGDIVMMRRSKAFFGVMVVLALIRLAARKYVNRIVSLEQTAGLFFVLAFGMILSWRISMLLEYRRLTGE